MPEGLRRILWFLAYWLLGITVLGVVAWAIRSVLM